MGAVGGVGEVQCIIEHMNVPSIALCVGGRGGSGLVVELKWN